MEEPAAYGKLGLANLLELREECLREFHFVDAYRSIKQRYFYFIDLVAECILIIISFRLFICICMLF